MNGNEFYNISKAQLISSWIFGLAGAIFCLGVAASGNDQVFGLVGIGLLFFLVFYSIGWRENRKQ